MTATLILFPRHRVRLSGEGWPHHVPMTIDWVIFNRMMRSFGLRTVPHTLMVTEEKRLRLVDFTT